MKRLLFLTFLLLGSLGRACLGVSEIRQFDWKTTERLGNELVSVSKRADCGFTTPAKKRARDTAIAALQGKLYDEVRYDYVVLDDPTGNGFLVYALAIAKKKNDVIVGGHFRVSVSADGVTAHDVDLLSQLIPQPKPDRSKSLVAISVSQLSANRPVETWIYSSDLYHLPIFVAAADASVWAIANDRIVRVDAKGPKNHLDILNKRAPEVPW